MNKTKSPILILRSGVCECKAAPMGRGGLEGYDEGQEYKFEQAMRQDPYSKWYRVYHQGEPEGYYETCGELTFMAHFKIITDQIEKGKSTERQDH